MLFEDTQRYSLDTPEGNAEWDVLLPRGEGTVHIDSQPYTLSMFHQLECLDIIRKATVNVARNATPSRPHPDGLERHCMNYLREMVLCRSDIRLEYVKELGAHSVERSNIYKCKNWELVYTRWRRMLQVGGQGATEGRMCMSVNS